MQCIATSDAVGCISLFSLQFFIFSFMDATIKGVRIWLFGSVRIFWFSNIGANPFS